jgi:hypothetical protein
MRRAAAGRNTSASNSQRATRSPCLRCLAGLTSLQNSRRQTARHLSWSHDRLPSTRPPTSPPLRRPSAHPPDSPQPARQRAALLLESGGTYFWRQRETEPGSGLRHRQMVRAAGKHQPPRPTATAPAADSTPIPGSPARRATPSSQPQGTPREQLRLWPVDGARSSGERVPAGWKSQPGSRAGPCGCPVSLL